MAASPDVLAIPGVVVGSVLLLVLSSDPVWGESVTIPLVLSAPTQIRQLSDHTSMQHTHTPTHTQHSTLSPATIRIKKRKHGDVSEQI